MSQEAINTFFEANYRKLVRFAATITSNTEEIGPEALVHQAWVKLSQTDSAWFVGYENPQRLQYVKRSIKNNLGDLRNKGCRKGLQTDQGQNASNQKEDGGKTSKAFIQKVDPGIWSIAPKNWEVLSSTFEKLINYQGPMPGNRKGNQAFQFDLEVRQLKVRSLVARWQMGKKSLAAQGFEEMITHDLVGFVEHLQPKIEKDSNSPWSQMQGKRMLSSSKEVRALIRNTKTRIMAQIQLAIERKQEIDYPGLFNRFSRDLEREVDPYLEELGVDFDRFHGPWDQVDSEPRLENILLLKGYLEGLEGADQAKGKILILKTIGKMSYEAIGREMNLTKEQVRYCYKQSLEEVKSYFDSAS